MEDRASYFTRNVNEKMIHATRLRHLSDGCKNGYGQASYLRLVDNKGKIHCGYLMGKSRVTPLKYISNPRLELPSQVNKLCLNRTKPRLCNF